MNGLRILDLSRVLAGPFATQQLADLGADVIKVESPEGDDTRGYGPIVSDVSTYFLAANRNKRSIVLDLRCDAGREVLARLVASADALVENFRPGVAERLGFGWEQLRASRTDLVYVAIHGFGDRAPADVTKRPGYDLVLQALGGAVSFTGHPGGPPTKHGCSSADLVAGMLAANAVLVGLLHRERTGEGQKLVVNMLQAQAQLLSYHATRFTVAGEVETPRGNAHRGLVPYDVYACADGWLAVGCGSDRIWQRLRDALSLPDEPAWRHNVGRVADRDRVDALVRDRLSAMTRADADDLLARHDVPAGPVLTVDQTLAHAAVELIAFEHPQLGVVRVPAPAFHALGERREHRAPPALGAQRDEICAEVGLSTEEVRILAGRGAFGDPSCAA